MTVLPDTVSDVYYIHAPDEVSDNEVTLIRVVGRYDLENIDSADTDVRMGVTLAVVQLDGAGVMVDDIDPIGDSINDYTNKAQIYRNYETFSGSSSSNAYHVNNRIDLRAKRKMSENQALVAVFRADSANDGRYFGHFRALFLLS